MTNIESALKQFVLLSSICLLCAPAASAAITIHSAADVSANAKQITATPKNKVHHTKQIESSDAEEFTNSFSLPFLPAITEAR